MDHQETIGLSVVERYLLGELSPLERDDFEDHFFNCHDCATDVRLTSQFLDGARRELGRGRLEERAPVRVRQSALGGWLAALLRPAVLGPVMALLLLVVGYQNFVVYPRLAQSLAQLRQPGILSAVSLISVNSRAGGHLQVNGTANQPVLLALDIPAEERFASYVCELVTASGTVLWQVPVSSSQARDTVSIGVPAGTLRSGDYAVVVKGLTHGSEGTVDLARYPFVLQFPTTNQP
jgi:Putative zinc-finger